jgi:topoisomerase-4 subunit A
MSINASSNDKIIFFSSNGKAYSLDASELPSGRGHGTPLKILLDIEEQHSVISVFPFENEKKYILASSVGNGFIVNSNDMLSNRKSGKQILNIKDSQKSIICKKIIGESVGAIGENKKMLIFSLSDLPELSRGKGVRIQKYKDSDLLFLDTFNLDDGLKIEDSAGRIRSFDNLNDWIGKRAQSGRLVPKGFPKLN